MAIARVIRRTQRVQIERQHARHMRAIHQHIHAKTLQTLHNLLHRQHEACRTGHVIDHRQFGARRDFGEDRIDDLLRILQGKRQLSYHDVGFVLLRDIVQRVLQALYA